MNAMRAALMERDANLARLQNEARIQGDNAERARVPPIILPDSIRPQPLGYFIELVELCSGLYELLLDSGSNLIPPMCSKNLRG